MEQPSLCRFVLWCRNNELPIWRVVLYTPGVPVQLRDLPWLAATCHDAVGPTIFEQFQYDLGEWTVEFLHDGQATILANSPIVLLRVQGVEKCPLFGYELAAFDVNLGFDYDAAMLREIDNRVEDSDAIRHIRVVAWTTTGARPNIHRISFNDDNTIKLGRHYYLHRDLGRWETVNMWIPGGEWEGGVCVHRHFWVKAKYNTILIKLMEVNNAVGLGKELIALERVGKVERGPRGVYVCLEGYMSLARAVNPVYDVAIPAEIQHRYEHMADGEGWYWGGNVVDMNPEVDTVEDDSDTGANPRKRSANVEDDGLRPSRRMRLSFAS